MSIEVQCACGRRLKVSAAAAGKRLKCPGCGEPVVVPADAPTSLDAECWTCPTSLTENLVVLTRSALVLAKVEEEALPEMVEALQGGVAPEAVLDAGHTVVQLDSLTAVEFDRHDRYLVFRFRRGKGSSAHTIFTPDRATRQVIADALRGRLGPGWQESELAVGRWLALIGPAGGLLLVALSGALFFGLGAAITPGVAPSFPVSAVAWVFDRFGAVLPGLAFGLAFLGCVAWLTSILVNPPLLVTLARPRSGS